MMDEECLNASKRRNIEETVLQILKTSDLETATEIGIRTEAADCLGFDLSGLPQRRLVRELIDSFLLSTATAILATTSSNPNKDDNNNDENVVQHEKQQQQKLRGAGVELQGNYNGKVICKLSDKRRVTIYDCNGTTMVSIRDFHIKDGNMVHNKGVNSGISMTAAKWSSFRNSFPAIQEAIVKLESRLRSEAVAKQSAADRTNSVADSAAEKSQTEACISNLTSIVHPPIKRKQTENEADMTNSVVDSAAGKSQTEAGIGISNLTSIFHPPIKRKQTEAGASRSVIAANSQEHILAERKQEEAGTSGSVVTSNSQEQIRDVRKQTEADISTSVPAFPTQGQLRYTVNAIRPERLIPAEREQTEADMSTSVASFPTQGQLHHTVNAIPSERLIPAKRKQNEADICASVPEFPTQGQLHCTVDAIHPERFIPIQTARLDGKNYHSWRHQMEFFLNQLNIAYVLAKPCPNISLNPKVSFDEKVKVKAAVQRWIDDDYMCRHNILNSLCDNLFQSYSHKSYSARELWEELKLVYDEDFGTKRSQISKYIHFQMVDGVSILEQVQELHNIANSIMASGTWIDENLHVSVIVSKLPPSWKEFRVRWMHEEFLPLNLLMHRLQVEEESRNCYKKEANYKKDHIIEPKVDYRLGKRKKENRRVCYSCGKEGHIIKDCPDRKFEVFEKSNEKENGAALSPQTGNNIVEAANTQ